MYCVNKIKYYYTAVTIRRVSNFEKLKTYYGFIFFIPAICCGQSREFKDYISNFREVKLPLEISQVNFKDIFPGNVWDKPFQIEKEYMKKFVYEDEGLAYKFITSDCSYGYEIKWETDDLYLVLIKIKRDKRHDIFNPDATILMLVVYNKQDNYIVRKRISVNDKESF